MNKKAWKRAWKNEIRRALLLFGGTFLLLGLLLLIVAITGVKPEDKINYLISAILLGVGLIFSWRALTTMAPEETAAPAQ